MSNAGAAGTGPDAGPDAGLNQDGTAPDAGTPDAGAPGRDYPPEPGGVTGNINLTMPLSAYQGRTDNPGEAAGYGPPGRRHLPGPRHHPNGFYELTRMVLRSCAGDSVRVAAGG